MLRIKLLFCLVLLVNTRNFAQNLVPNPSFEIHSTCPTNYNQVTLATGWQKSLNNNAPQYHTEYLNACSSNSLFQVPNNTWGIQAAFNGQAYMALNTMAPSVFVNYRENIYIQLSAPLVIGQQYKIKLHASHTDNSKFVTNNLGVKFSTTTNFPINNSAHIYSSTIITTNTSWDTIQGFFIADSAYQYMAIGNFFTDANTTRVLNYPSAAYSLDAYYIDDVSVTLNCIPPIATITGNTNSICPGDSITLTVNGGSSYLWNTGSTDSSITVKPGLTTLYTVVAGNGTCNSNPDSAIVTILPIPVLTLLGDTVSCNNSPVQLIAVCPAAQSIHWSNNILSSNDTVSVAANFPSYISAYAFDGQCNSQPDSIWVDTLSSPTLSVNFLPSSCINDTVHFSTITNASNFTWNFGHSASGASNISNLSNPIHVYNNAGNYSINLVAQNYCGSTSFTSPITVQSGPTVSLTNDTTICKGNSISLNASGGTNYQWSGAINATASSVLVSPLVNSTYLVKASNGTCFGPIDSVTVSVAVQPLISLVGDSVSCNSGPVQLIANCPSGQTFHWSSGISSTNDTILISTGFPAYISAYAFDGICNSMLDSIWVDTLSSPTLSVNFLPSSCINDTVHFSAITNASNFTWNFGHIASGASNTSNLSNPIHVYNSAGNYSINLVAQNYCGSTSFTSPITVQSGPTVSLTNDTTICKGNSISLNASGGTNYQWSGAINATASSVLVSPLVNSTYLVKASNGTCFGPIDSVTVSVAVQPLISLAGDSVSCNSGPVQLIANCPSGQTFHWSSGISSTNDTILISTGFPAYISAYAFDGICNSMLDSIWVDTLSSPTLSVNFLPSSCINDTVHFSASTNASNFTWNFGHSASGASNTSNLANPIHVYNSAGNYSINLVAQNYCGSTSFTSPIAVQSGPTVILPNDTTICKGQNVNLLASGGVNYVWSGAISANTASVLVAPLVPSTYIVKVSNGTCFGSPDTIVVNPIDKPIVLLSGNDTVCTSELITLTASGASTYYWNGALGTGIDTIQVAPLVSTTYAVVGSIGGCKSDTGFFKVTVSNLSTADFSYSLDTCSGEILFLNKSSLANSYKWIFGDGFESTLMHPIHSYSESGTYQTSLITNPGKSCSDTLIDKIKYDEYPDGYLFIPNAFSPDGDGLNDVYTIKSYHNCKLLSLEIYDRWGVLVYQTQGTQVSWDGKSNGFIVPVGVYVYVVNYNNTEKSGSLTLFR